MSSLPSPGGAKRILLVEDEKPMRDVLEIALANGGFQVVTATDGNEAMNLARLMHFDLVITDMIMPGMEGIETIMALLAHDPGIKIIAMSGVQSGGKGDFLPLAKSLGASAIIRKPLDRETFIATVRGVIEQDERRLDGRLAGPQRQQEPIRRTGRSPAMAATILKSLQVTPAAPQSLHTEKTLFS